VRELESSLLHFADFLLKANLANQKAAPYFVRWVRQFLSRPATTDPIDDQIRQFVEDLERTGRWDAWQVRQAEQAVRVYLVSFLKETTHQAATTVETRPERSRNQLSATADVRRLLRLRHYAYRTECTYIDWIRRFYDYARARQGRPEPEVTTDVIRDFLSHLAIQRHVAASTQNQAMCALLFLARHTLALDVEGLGDSARARSSRHTPTVLSVAETRALLEAMDGTARLMAEVIYGGGLCVSECCQLRIKDVGRNDRRTRVASGHATPCRRSEEGSSPPLCYI
jgi:integrase